ncbi:MAG: adenylyl-sulfate kinase [Bacteroidetes bacterium]|nr:adenylyl-sulfate kinase [Bacteroidota bacterium]
MIIQFCGMSGAGKTTLARAAQKELQRRGIAVEIIDGDEYRASLCKGLGFSKQDRMENMRRMAFVAHQLSRYGIVSIICAINPYEEMRKEIRDIYPNVSTAHLDCSVEVLKIRDTKGLYQKAFLSADNPNKITNLTGINDPFEVPKEPDLYINTDTDTIVKCVNKLVQFIIGKIKSAQPLQMPVRHHAANTLYKPYMNL